MTVLPPFSDGELTALANIVAGHLTHSEITSQMSSAGFDVCLDGNKYVRVKTTFQNDQDQFLTSNRILAFIKRIVDPVLFLDSPEKHADLIKSFNEVLSFAGYKLTPSGQLSHMSSNATTISEAKRRAADFRSELINRNIHSDLLAYCKPELLEENYFHAVFEAVKSYCDKIRDKTGIQADGANLFATAFSINNPYLAINTLRTESELSEQKGFSNLLQGMYGMFRNTTAHDPKIKRVISRQDAIDAFTTMSYIHRRLDLSAVIKKD